MKKLFDVTDVDLRFYEKNLKGFLPKKIIDIHTHVWLGKDKARTSPRQKRTVSWPTLVAKENPIESLRETYRLLLPDQEVAPLIFSNAGPGDDLDLLNGYISQAAQQHSLSALIFATPS